MAFGSDYVPLGLLALILSLLILGEDELLLLPFSCSSVGWLAVYCLSVIFVTGFGGAATTMNKLVAKTTCPFLSPTYRRL